MAEVVVDRPITIATVSGKGGVGKTAVTIGTAMALRDLGYRVGIIDLDLESSSLGDVLGVTRDNLVMTEKIEPVEVHGLKAVSLSLFPQEDWVDVPTLIEEERVYALVGQMFKSVNWGELDFLCVDFPPGTGSELRALIRQRVHGLILVAAAQRVSELPVRRLVRMAREEYRLNILGVVSNNPYNVDGADSGKAISERYSLPLLATIRWDRSIAEAMDNRTAMDVTPFQPIAKALQGYFFPEPKPKAQARTKRKQPSKPKATRRSRKPKGDQNAD
ncbi:MAG: P-loop NTPase [Chloroflexota bacterium]